MLVCVCVCESLDDVIQSVCVHVSLDVVLQCLWTVDAAVRPLVSLLLGSCRLIGRLLSGGGAIVEVLDHDDQFALWGLQSERLFLILLLLHLLNAL